MKRVSLKVKLTILYTFFTLLVTCIALAILFSLSSKEMLAGTQERLKQRVQRSTEDITMSGDAMKIDSDFYSVTGDVYLALYDENMFFLYGKNPYGFNTKPELSDGQMRRIREGNEEWYVYDLVFRLDESNTVIIRGVTSITEAEKSFAVTLRFAMILFPAMVLATALMGYRFTRRTLFPVKKMTDTVEEIRADADLSRRIGLKDGKQGDEIYILAKTFDGMLEELEEVFEREKQFTSDVSHELRTPISVILAQCGACLEDDTLTERQRAQILLIEKKAKDMSELIAHLLFLSRADQGRQPLRKEWINVSELTQMTAEEQQILADEQGREIRICWQTGEDICASVDETLYIRMLVNLISNAVAYGKEKGTVTVELTEKNEQVIGTVRDDGIGICAEDLPKIWTRFYRADSSRSGENHSGLGLSMVKWIVEAHGGWIRAESTPGEGSVFIFGLPKGSPDESADEREEKHQDSIG